VLDVPSVLGWVGMGLLLFAYARRRRLNAPAYSVLNLVGAVLIAVVCFHQKAWPPMALNCVWAIIAARDLLGARALPAQGSR